MIDTSTDKLVYSHEYWYVENTGLSGGLIWYPGGGKGTSILRFTNPAAAESYSNKRKKLLNDPLMLWRVVHIVFDRYACGDITNKSWGECL